MNISLQNLNILTSEPSHKRPFDLFLLRLIFPYAKPWTAFCPTGLPLTVPLPADLHLLPAILLTHPLSVPEPLHLLAFCNEHFGWPKVFERTRQSRVHRTGRQLTFHTATSLLRGHWERALTTGNRLPAKVQEFQKLLLEIVALVMRVYLPN